jgi:hypothetical protein
MTGDLIKMGQLPTSISEQDLILRSEMLQQSRPKLDKLMIFGDSFSSALIDWLYVHFRDIKHINDGRSAHRPLDFNVVNEYKPDVVIFEAVERYWVRD